MSATAHMYRLRKSLDGDVALGAVVQRLGRDGIGLLAIVLSIPFLIPIPLAGLGTPVGVLMISSGIQLTLGHETLWLPRFVSERRLERRTVERALAISEKILHALEKFTRPRLFFIARRNALIGAAIIALGLGFALPIFVPFGNPLSATAMIFLGLSLLEEDGLSTLIGLAVATLSAALHIGFFVLLWTGGHSLLHFRR